MDREKYVAPIIESYFPEASQVEKIALTQELWMLFDALYAVYLDNARVDSIAAHMVESESHEKLISVQNL